ncbi:MAG: undecaprenyldiphospho-muramoylpentapeptide beta-N-acetylglucosaminyltransferase [Alphaproteobacteria bacterium]
MTGRTADPRAQAADAPIVLATGGTGGHVFPAQALAAELGARGHRVVLVTDARGGAFDEASAVHRIRAATPGRSPVAMLKAGLDIALGTLTALRLLRRLRPAAVVGFGGYASVPTMLAAGWLRLPTLIHEQNAVLGRANRLLAGRVRRIATAFERMSALPATAAERTVRTGNPVRPAIAALRSRPYAPPAADERFHLLVTGGSQGARVLSEVIPAAIDALPPPLRRRLAVVQQCRPEDLEAVRAAYAAAGVDAELASFFADMPERLAAAHLVIARAGASTVAELGAAGRPAILVPYPFAMDDHQSANARAVADAAWVRPQRDLAAADLARLLAELMDDPAALAARAAAATAHGRPDAARLLADLVEAELAARPGTHEASLRGVAA